MTYETKDSGKRVEFKTGSVRDEEEGKLDYTLLPFKSLARLVGLYTRGAQKYTRFNWQKGQDMARVDRSLARHFVQYLSGERDEDHLAAIAWNAICLMDHEDRIQSGELPESIDTRDEWRRVTPPSSIFPGLYSDPGDETTHKEKAPRPVNYNDNYTDWAMYDSKQRSRVD